MALTDNLEAYWSLEEASGTRQDATVANLDLTDNNTVTSNTGKVGTAAQFTRANAEYLSIADNAALSAGDTDFTIQAWVYRDSDPGGVEQMRIVDKYLATIKEYSLLWYAGDSKFYVFASADGTADTSFVVSTGTGSISTWYCLHAWHDSVNNQIGLAVNAGTPDTASHTSGIANMTSPFEIGRNGDAPGRFYWDGRIDEVGFWRRVLTSQERTDLYNGGNGLAYPFTGGGGGGIVRQMMQHHHYRKPQRQPAWRKSESGIYMRAA